MGLNFDSAKHIYTYNEPTIGNLLLKSVTTFLKQFEPVFDVEKMAAQVAAKKGTTPEIIKLEWETKAKASSTLGTNVHKFCESKVNEKLGKPFEKVNLTMQESFRGSAVDKFWNEHPNWKPTDAELQIFNLAFRLAGTVDLLIKDENENIFILDWKTNGYINTENNFNEWLLPPVSHLQNCNYNIYCLQLSLYKFLLEATGKKIAGMKLVHLKDNHYTIYDCPYKDREVTELLKARLAEFKK